MLKAIKCDRFATKQVEFHPGLNVILGDNEATNSIGKSTFLMVIDYAFGGTDFLTHNKDVMSELGDHYYDFLFLHGNESHWFRRYTSDDKQIFRLNATVSASSVL